MTESLPNLAPDSIPRMGQPAPFRPQVLNGEINGQKVILLIIESVNGTFSFTLPLDYLADSFMPMLNGGLVAGGHKSILPGKLVPATLDDLRNIHQNGQGGLG